jgi:hypothetical protein
MEKIRKAAIFCTARMVFLASIAIYLVVMFFSSDPAFAFRAGAILTLIMAGVLAWKAGFVLRQEPSNMEVWAYLDNGTRQSCMRDKRPFRDTMRHVYGRFSLHTLAIACIMFAISTGMTPLGEQPAAETQHAGVSRP